MDSITPAIIFFFYGDTFVIVRGGNYTGPNYEEGHIKRFQELMKAEGLVPNILIDCSHDNTIIDPGTGIKDFKRQLDVAEDALRQMVDGNVDLIGLSLESYILEGNSPLPKNLTDLQRNPREVQFGKSRTDKCIGLEDTLRFLDYMHKSL